MVPLEAAAIVTVRNSSTRLPGKALLPVAGMSGLEVVLTRAALTGLPVIVATSTDPGDDPLAELAVRHGHGVYRGDLLHKINRWHGCFEHFGLESALLVDGDDLLYDPALGLRALGQLLGSGCELVRPPPEVVCGLFTYAIARSGIVRLAQAAAGVVDTDVITVFIERAGLRCETVALLPWERGYPFRLTLDYPEDLLMFQRLIPAVGVTASGRRVVEYLTAHPEVVAINQGRQADFLANQERFNRQVSGMGGSALSHSGVTIHHP